MRRMMAAVLTVVLLSACSKIGMPIPDSGLYVAQPDDVLVIALDIADGRCIRADHYVKGHHIQTWNDVETTLKEGTYEYAFGYLKISADFEDSRSFRGTLNGSLYAQIGREDMALIFEQTVMDFSIHAGELDADDDGILDDYPVQQILSK